MLFFFFFSLPYTNVPFAIEEVLVRLWYSNANVVFTIANFFYLDITRSGGYNDDLLVSRNVVFVVDSTGGLTLCAIPMTDTASVLCRIGINFPVAANLLKTDNNYDRFWFLRWLILATFSFSFSSSFEGKRKREMKKKYWLYIFLRCTYLDYRRYRAYHQGQPHPKERSRFRLRRYSKVHMVRLWKKKIMGYC